MFLGGARVSSYKGVRGEARVYCVRNLVGVSYGVEPEDMAVL